MRIVLPVILLAALSGTTASAAALPPPLTPASDGRLQCYVPNVQAKTCQLVASFVPQKDGSIQNIATVVVSSDPLITMTTSSPVQVREGRVCGLVHAEDFAAAQFTVDGKPADLRQTADLRAHLAEGMKPLIGHEICTAFVRQGATWVAQPFFDGARKTDGDEAFDWVPPNAGWKVAP